MRWNWLRDKETHRELKYYWAPGKENDADYFTKHIPPNYNQKAIQILSLRASTLPPCTPIEELWLRPHICKVVFFTVGVQTAKQRLHML